MFRKLCALFPSGYDLDEAQHPNPLNYIIMKKFTLLSAILGAACTFCYGQLIDCKEPFISEMIEGTADNKAVELFNPSETPVDLNDFSIRLFKDGQVTSTDIQLSGTLAAKSKFVIAHPAANSDIISKADMLDAQLNYDGNDAIVVEKTGGIQTDKNR